MVQNGGQEGIFQDVPPARQFDFWLGQWAVNNRFIQEDGSWQDVGTGVANIYSILGGKAILELWDGTFRSGFQLLGFSLRYYDTAEEVWKLALNWPMPEQPSFSHLEGIFRHGRGEFFRTTIDEEGVETIARYTFSDITPSTLRWDDAFSTDGGLTWKVHWIMEFTRTADVARWPEPGESFPTYHQGTRCSADEARQFDALEGVWGGTCSRKENGTWVASPARLRGARVLDGCAVMDLVEYERDGMPYGLFRLRSYLPQSEQWMVLHLDNQPDTGFEYQAGRFQGEQITTTEYVADKTSKKNELKETTWTRLSRDVIQYESAVTTDGGANWTVTEKVELEREA